MFKQLQETLRSAVVEYLVEGSQSKITNLVHIRTQFNEKGNAVMRSSAAGRAQN